ncbi:hypothetical protein HY628_02410 [Candidatus Uhrbacteria bacterium]|nr:hypothetical protein [Candidatus Uhrbacteria bacterium]
MRLIASFSKPPRWFGEVLLLHRSLNSRDDFGQRVVARLLCSRHCTLCNG